MSSLFYSFLFSILFSSTASLLKSMPLPINSVPSQIMNHSALCRFSSFLLCAVASQLDSNACLCTSSLRLRSSEHIISLPFHLAATRCYASADLSGSSRCHSVTLCLCCSNLSLSTLCLSYSVHGLFFCNATLFLRLSWLFFTHPPLYCSSLHYSLPSLVISLLRLFHA